MQICLLFPLHCLAYSSVSQDRVADDARRLSLFLARLHVSQSSSHTALRHFCLYIPSKGYIHLSTSDYRYQMTAKTSLHDAGLMSCETIKFFGSRKAVKAAYGHTNKQTKSALDQVRLLCLSLQHAFMNVAWPIMLGMGCHKTKAMRRYASYTQAMYLDTFSLAKHC